MTTISAEVITKSVSPDGIELTSMKLRYPRWIHAEGRTHRQLKIGECEYRTPSLMEDPNLSRNASSSRAIPVKRLIQDVLDDPAVPLFWGANKPGMQAGEEQTNLVDIYNGDFPQQDPLSREEAWLFAMKSAVKAAEAFDRAGYHKQIVNRLLEPFSHITVIVTATEWSNFYALRDHPDAEPHIRLLAQRMKKAQDDFVAFPIDHGMWHLPFITAEDRDEAWSRAKFSYPEYWDILKKVSAARCARVSYITHNGMTPLLTQDLALFERLAGSEPLHASPIEHQATPDRRRHHMPEDYYEWEKPHLHGNFKGWCQNRQFFPNQSQ